MRGGGISLAGALVALGCNGVSLTRDSGARPDTRPVLTLEVHGQGNVKSTPAGIDCADTCSAPFEAGTAVSFSPAPAAGFRFDGWGGACSGAGPCTVTLQASTRLFATFVPQEPARARHRLSLTVTGGGRVRSIPAGIDCGASCEAEFDRGTSVSLVAEPGPGSRFERWSGACGGGGACTIELSSDSRVGAAFAPLPPPPPPFLQVTLVGSGGGRVVSTPPGIDCPTTCNASFERGTSITLSATPDAASAFTAWGGACAGAGTCTVPIGGNADIFARFERAPAVVLARDAHLSELALNSTLVVFALQDGSSYTIDVVPKAGGAARVLYSGPGLVHSIVADDQYVFWTATFDARCITRTDGAGALFRTTLADGSTVWLATGNRFGRLANDASAVYTVSGAVTGSCGGAGEGMGQVLRYARASGSLGILASGQSPTGAVGIDDASVYWGNRDSYWGSEIRKLSLEKLPATIAIVHRGSPYAWPLALKVDPAMVFFRDSFGSVFSVDKSGLNPARPIAEGNSEAAPDLDVQSSLVYWTNQASTSRAAAGLWRAAADGSDRQTLDSSQGSYRGVRVDGQYVFYIGGDALLRRPR